MDEQRIEAALGALGKQRPLISSDIVEKTVRTVNAVMHERQRRVGINAAVSEKKAENDGLSKQMSDRSSAVKHNKKIL